MDFAVGMKTLNKKIKLQLLQAAQTMEHLASNKAH